MPPMPHRGRPDNVLDYPQWRTASITMLDLNIQAGQSCEYEHGWGRQSL
jgi:hypothetical protein